ncbi:MAG: tRNA modification GTPase, partial [Planctomycetaceae bacterium]
MNFHLDDTIAALASAPGPGGLSLIRVSGPRTRELVGECFVPDDDNRWESAGRPLCHRGNVTVSAIRSPIPATIYLWPTNRSYTGQMLAELHLPGSPPLVEAVLAELFTAGARPAGAGEFTLRAFLAGKIDLVQAEAVLGVIDAGSPIEFRVALEQLAGGISGKFSHLRQQLLELLADLEAGLDFVDEDIEFVSRTDVEDRLRSARDELLLVQQQSQNRMQAVGYASVALAGLPNAGKSTLFNALIGEQAALVSEEAGTTRDYLSHVIHWKNTAWELIDTAGWEETNIGIQGRAQSLRLDQWQRADLILWCESSDKPDSAEDDDRRLLDQLQTCGRPIIRIRTKVDLPTMNSGESRFDSCQLAVSAVSGVGLPSLNDTIAAELAGNDSTEASWLGSTAARCAESLQAAIEAIDM